MKHSDPEDFDLPEGSEIIKGQNLYKHHAFRCIVCPNGEKVFLQPRDLGEAYRDLQTWALPITWQMMNQ